MVQGGQHLPATGVFVLAANHYGTRRALDTIAAVLSATAPRRPDLAGKYLLIVGNRAPRRGAGPLAARPARLLLRLVFRRWARHTLRIPLGNERASVAFLREWRRRARRQPCLVFPEGRARPAMAAIRPGAGRWLATLEAPVLPVGVWHAQDRWQVRIGPPLRWSSRPDLRDAQLGLAIAALLPPEVAPAWGEALRHWQEAHAAPH